MKKEGITNTFSQAGILAIISKESGFVPKSENLNYTSDQLQKVFALSKDNADGLAHKAELIADTVYMPPHNTQLGNINTGDGYAYRGRGYNQITGRANYKKIGDEIGVDLISNPDLLNDPLIAAKSVLVFFRDGIKALIKNGRMTSMYNTPSGNINDFKNTTDSVGAFYNINAGVGQSEKFLMNDVTKGRSMAIARVEPLYNLIKTLS